MRTALNFPCKGVDLAATLDDAGGSSGLLIVSGGNEIRSGAHRGMAALAAQIAATGHPVLRFDRRGIGDSAGENRGFESSRDDIEAAVLAFRSACPAMKHIVAFGNCDAASALALHQPLGVDALVLANPWTIDAAADDAPALPPASAIRARYWQRLRDPASLLRLLRGEVDFGKLARGMAKLGSGSTPSPGSLANRVVAAIAAAPVPVTLLLATGDRTAQAFAENWRGSDPEARARVPVAELASASHSFAGEDGAWLAERLLELLNERAN